MFDKMRSLKIMLSMMEDGNIMVWRGVYVSRDQIECAVRAYDLILDTEFVEGKCPFCLESKPTHSESCPRQAIVD
jgi:hypothetical protein